MEPVAPVSAVSAGNLHVAPRLATVERVVRPTGAVVQPGEVATDAVVVRACDEVAAGSVGLAAMRRLVLRRRAAEVREAAVVHRITDDRVHLGRLQAARTPRRQVERRRAAEPCGRVRRVELFVVTFHRPRRVDRGVELPLMRGRRGGARSLRPSPTWRRRRTLPQKALRDCVSQIPSLLVSPRCPVLRAADSRRLRGERQPGH